MPKFQYTAAEIAKMSTILMLIEEVAWLMAPATLIAAILVITLVSVVKLEFELNTEPTLNLSQTGVTDYDV